MSPSLSFDDQKRKGAIPSRNCERYKEAKQSDDFKSKLGKNVIHELGLQRIEGDAGDCKSKIQSRGNWLKGEASEGWGGQ